MATRRAVRDRSALPMTAAAFALALTTLAASGGHQTAAPDAEEADDSGLVLEAADTVAFTTDEGTWMSLDVSPDGRTIVFDLLGDLYTLPIDGGTATRIVGEMSFESQPRFSPDGSTIAFLSDRSGVENLWIADADGSNPRAVTTDSPTKDRPQIMSSPAWTPDGEYILASKQRPPERTFAVFLYHRDGATGVRIGEKPPPPDPEASTPYRPPNRLGAMASPDGRFVYYTERKGSFTYNARFPLWQVIRFDRRTGDTATVTNAQGSAMRPVLSPDGRFLVYATRFETETGLRVRDLETREERWLIHPVTRDDQESRASRDTMPGYAFTPDGTGLIVPIAGKIARVEFETGATRPVPFTAQVQAEIAPRVYFEHRVEDSPTLRARLIRWPVLSPDGTQLAFTALHKLWIMDLPDGAPRRLTGLTDGEFMPAWSPDGAHVAFVTWSTEGGHVYRVTTSPGATPERLTQRAGHYAEPVYTPDGSRIVVLVGGRADQLFANLPAGRAGSPDVFPAGEAPAEIAGIAPAADKDLVWIPSDGGASTLIGSSQGASGPHFADDPDRVYLSSSGKGLVSIRLDGVDRRSHLQVKGTGAGEQRPSATTIRLAPDGRQALVSLQNALYLIQVPRVGGESITVDVTGDDASSVPVRSIAGQGADYVAWSIDGQQMTWALGARFYRQTTDARQGADGGQAVDGGQMVDRQAQTGDVPEVMDTPEVVDIVVEATRSRPEGTVVLRGARIVTMAGDEIVEDGTIVVTDNRVTAVGPSRTVSVPAGARTIDVGGTTIIPGFVDVHAHMWVPRGVHQPQVWQYLANLAHGVTTTRDPQTSTNDVFAYGDLVETGDILGPRILATGPGVFANSGLTDEETTRQFIDRYRDAYRTDTIKAYVPGDRLVRQWVIAAARERGIMPTTEGALDMKLDLSQMTDGFTGLEHSLPIQPIYRDVAEFVARTKTFYTPTILVAYGAPWTENLYFESGDIHANEKVRRFIPHELLDTMVRRRGQWFRPDEYGHRGIARGVAAIVRAGGKVGLGSHGQFQGLGAHWELWSLQSGGLSPHETLRLATLVGAEALGLQRDLGSLEPGKLADLIVLEENPLEDIHHTTAIRYVMKNGELFEGDTLDRVWPSPRTLEGMYWWQTDPPTGATGPP